MNILGQLETDPRHARAVDIIRHHDQEQTMTDQTVTAAATALRQPSTVSQAIHSSLLHARAMGAEIESHLGEVGRAVHHALPMIERIISDPSLDELVEVALRASDAGVTAEVFQALTDALRSATASKTGPNPVLPSPVTPPDVTAAQPAVPDAAAQDPAGNGGQP